MNSLVKYLSSVIIIAFTLMWLLSYSFYTSVGIDASYPNSNAFLSVQYRIRWPGNGSFWVGRIAREYVPLPNAKPDVDLGGAVFKAPVNIEMKSLWNRWGFWWLSKRERASDFNASSNMLNTW
ncbi:MAG: hypothetical protein KDJ65_07480 [Anaerolineae bacterium]|nr:hypothetical protein [Anaerolineae bacterium]